MNFRDNMGYGDQAMLTCSRSALASIFRQVASLWPGASFFLVPHVSWVVKQERHRWSPTACWGQEVLSRGMNQNAHEDAGSPKAQLL